MFKPKIMKYLTLIVLINLNSCTNSNKLYENDYLKRQDNLKNINNDDTSSISTNILHNNNINQIKSSLPITNLGFIHAFIASISVILVSELGDKTFFIAAIMAMRHPRCIIFIGAISALALMTILSAVFGMAATIIPRIYTYYISTALFAIFGLKMLKDGWYMSATDVQEELEEVQLDLRKREDELMKSIKNGGITTANTTHQNNCDVTTNQSSLQLNYNENDIVNKDKIKELCKEDTISSKTIKNKQYNCNNMHKSKSANNLSQQLTNEINSKLSSATSIAAIIRRDSGISIKNSTLHNNQIYNNINFMNNTINYKSSMTNINSTMKNNQQSNGMELKQLGSKKRLEKEATAALLQDTESGIIRKSKQPSAAYMTSRVFIQAFTMTFLAEWGDRSQLTTIILSAREDVYGVIIGGILGHSFCTGLAVVGGRLIAQKISVRTVTLLGGVVFLIFALSALFFNPNEEET